jgi:hypothetical protein
MLLGLKGRDSIKELIAQNTKAPDVHTSIMLYTLHCFTIPEMSARQKIVVILQNKVTDCFPVFFEITKQNACARRSVWTLGQAGFHA